MTATQGDNRRFMTPDGQPPERIGDEEWSEYVAGFETPGYRQRLTRRRLIHRWHHINLRPVATAICAVALFAAGAYFILRP